MIERAPRGQSQAALAQRELQTSVDAGKGNGHGARGDSKRRPIFRPAEPDEAKILTEIAHASKRHWDYPDEWILAWKEDLTVTPEFVAEHDVVVCEMAGNVVGMFALVLEDEYVELEHFWVLPEVMGDGVGRSMFEKALTRATATGSRKLRIVSDPNATGFYERLGARHCGVLVGEVCGATRELPIMSIDLA